MDPGVQLHNVLEAVVEIGWRGAIPLEPDKLGRVQDRGYDQLVLLEGGMEGVLGLNHFFEVNKPLYHGGDRGTPHEVVQPSSHKHFS